MKAHERTTVTLHKDTVKELEQIEGYPIDRKIQKLINVYLRTKEMTNERLKEIFRDDFNKFMDEQVKPEVDKRLNLHLGSLKEAINAVKEEAIEQFKSHGTGLVIEGVMERVAKILDRRLKEKELSNPFITADTL